MIQKDDDEVMYANSFLGSHIIIFVDMGFDKGPKPPFNSVEGQQMQTLCFIVCLCLCEFLRCLIFTLCFGRASMDLKICESSLENHLAC